jgi:spore germination cell wall hydrolase CwlJ-like protein
MFKSIVLLSITMMLVFVVTDLIEKTESLSIENTFPESEVECLAKNIYFEARGESLKGMQAVANVVMNRVRRTGNSVCTIVYQPYQFSWTLYKHAIDDYDSFNKAKEIASEALDNKLKDITNGSTHFHAVYVDPEWAHQLKYTKTIGNHIFYKG